MKPLRKMRFRICIVFLIGFLGQCSRSDKFDRDVWLSNNDVADKWNPRANMTNDLLENYLKPAMTRDSILNMLGKPYFDGIENRPPKGIEIPDSLSLAMDSAGLASLLDSADLQTKNKRDSSKIKTARELKEFNAWYKAHSHPDTLMLYPVGWSTMDPNFLVIKFRPDGTAYEFWVEQR